MNSWTSTKIFCCRGFSKAELIIVCGIAGILSSIAIPALSNLAPDYRLKKASRILYSDMQSIKMRAIRENRIFRIEFLTDGSSSYRLIGPDNSVIKTVELSGNSPGSAVSYGSGNAAKAATVAGGKVPPDGVSYASNRVTFNPMGRGSMGYVYLQNSRGNSLAVGTWISGVIVIKRWNESTKSWE